MSSTHSPAIKCTDGQTVTSGGREICHTNLDQDAWIRIDLGTQYVVHEVTLWDRTDATSCDQPWKKRARNLEIRVGNNPSIFTSNQKCAYHGPALCGTHKTLACSPGPIVGRYVTVQHKNISKAEYLNLAEIEVIGFKYIAPGDCSKGSNSFGCMIECRCNNNSESCDYLSGICQSGCSQNYIGKWCESELKLFSNLTKSALTDNSVNVSWTAYSGSVVDSGRGTVSVQYQVVYRKISENTWTNQESAGVLTHHTITGLTPNTEYKIAVSLQKLVNSQLISTASQTSPILNIQTLCAVPGPPASLDFSFTKDTLKTTLTWTAPNSPNCDFINYRLTCEPISTTSTTPLTDIKTINKPKIKGSITTLDITTSLIPFTQYNCSIFALNSIGGGSPASVSFWTGEITIPLLVVKKAAVTDTTVTLQITRVNTGNITGYEVIVKKHNGPISRRRKLTVNQSQYVSYEEAKQRGLSVYITAVLPPEVPSEFIVGDTRNYSGYFNAPLETGKSYSFILGIIENYNGQTFWHYPPIEQQERIIVKAPWSIAWMIIGGVGAALLTLLLMAVVQVIVRRRGGCKTRQTSNNADVSMENIPPSNESIGKALERLKSVPGEENANQEHTAHVNSSRAVEETYLNRSQSSTEGNTTHANSSREVEETYLNRSQSSTEGNTTHANSSREVEGTYLNRSQSSTEGNTTHANSSREVEATYLNRSQSSTEGNTTHANSSRELEATYVNCSKSSRAGNTTHANFSREVEGTYLNGSQSSTEGNTTHANSSREVEATYLNRSQSSTEGNTTHANSSREVEATYVNCSKSSRAGNTTHANSSREVEGTYLNGSQSSKEGNTTHANSSREVEATYLNRSKSSRAGNTAHTNFSREVKVTYFNRSKSSKEAKTAHTNSSREVKATYLNRSKSSRAGNTTHANSSREVKATYLNRSKSSREGNTIYANSSRDVEATYVNCSKSSREGNTVYANSALSRESSGYINIYEDGNAVDESQDDEDHHFASKGATMICDLLGDTLIKTSDNWKNMNKEFQGVLKLRRGLSECAGKVENVEKNSFPNMLAYDSTRVVLEQTGEEPTSDYINANYIWGLTGHVICIACQAPLPSTFNDHWRMIWQEKCPAIIVLTDLTEGQDKDKKVKCHSYWPTKLNTKGRYGDITVKVAKKMEKHTEPPAVVHFLSIKKRGHKQAHKLLLFQYRGWPDHGVPFPALSVVRMQQFIKQRLTDPDQGLVLVHGSAGAGRTGCYIATEQLLEKAKKDGLVNVFDMFRKLRQQRPEMIQNMKQYILVHQILLEELVLGPVAYPTRSFRESYEERKATRPVSRNVSDKIEEQFLVLKASAPIQDEESLAVAKLLNNVYKSRYEDILPEAQYQPQLSHKGFINASFVHTITDDNVSITTQSPMPNTITDFWQMIFDYNCEIIVMMHQEYPQDPTYASYWPAAGSIKCSPFTITVEEVSLLCKTIVRRDLTIQKQNESHLIRQIQFLGWPEDESVPDLQYLFEFVKLVTREHVTSPIVVHCMDSTTRTGLFCAAFELISKAPSSEKIDIYHCIQKLRMTRPQFIPNLEQYKLLHELVILYLQGHDTYVNLS
ncbi:uncharacterized protein LOC141914037 isoform X2 [Tubulanus polymorphus]